MSGRSIAAGSLFLAGAVLALSVSLPAQQVPQFRANGNAVAVSVTVTDKNGRLVPNLTPDDFQIEDNGKRQTITVFDINPQPITVLLLLDRSESVNPSFHLVERAVDQFVGRMLPPDKARIGTFSYATIIEPDTFTHDRGELLRALRLLPPQGGPSPIWNTADKALALLEKEAGRRVLLLFTDGYDEPLRNGKSLSFYAVAERARASDVMVYSIGLEFFYEFRRRTIQRAPESGLGYIAKQTGGGYVELREDVNLVDAFAQVADELHSQYALGFVPEKLDGKRHTLWVRMKRDGLRARFRESYVATPAALK